MIHLRIKNDGVLKIADTVRKANSVGFNFHQKNVLLAKRK